MHTSLLVFLLSLAGSGAQDSGGRKPVLEFAPASPQPEAPSVSLTPAQRVAAAMPAMLAWPRESGEQAIQNLVRDHRDAVPALRDLLVSGTVLERAVAARALCVAGDRESADTVAALLLDPRQSGRAAELLESLADLVPEQAHEASLSFLESSSLALRRAASSFLETRPSAAATARARALVAGSKLPEVRRDAYHLLVSWNDPALLEVALDLVGDPDAALAADVADTLIGRRAVEAQERLLQLATADRDREALHALLILAASERRTRQHLLPRMFFEDRLPDLRSSDPLLRGVACMTCAVIGYRTEELSELTQAEVLPALAEFVIQIRMFPDFRLCFRNAVAMLEWLTGQHLGENVPAWREYWQQHQSGGVLSLQELTAARAEREAGTVAARLDEYRHGGWRPRLELLGDDRPAAAERAGIVLPRAAMGRLVGALSEAGLFRTELPRELSEDVSGALRLTVGVPGREMSLAAVPGDPEMQRFEYTLWDAALPFLWQFFVPWRSTDARRVREEEAWWLQHTASGERLQRLVNLALVDLEGASIERQADVLRILGELRRLRPEDLTVAVTQEQMQRLARYLSGLQVRDERSAEAFEFLASLGPAAFDVVVDALAPAGTASLLWLEQALERFDRRRSGLTDPRPLVRLAAVNGLDAASMQDPEVAELVAALARTDPELKVRQAALVLVAAEPGEASLNVVLAAANSPDTATRTAALRALGRSPHPGAVAVLRAALDAADTSTVQAAIEGLGMHRSVEAAEALEALVQAAGAEGTRGFLALAALRNFPREIAQASLLDLTRSPDPETVREARYGLADLGDLSTVDFLVEEMAGERQGLRAQNKLLYLFCQDFTTDPARYRSLHESNPALTPRDYFLEALRAGGTPLPADASPSDPEVLRVLALGVADPRWYVRRHCLENLEAVTGTELGRLGVNASEEECAVLAQRWTQFLSGWLDEPAESSAADPAAGGP